MDQMAAQMDVQEAERQKEEERAAAEKKAEDEAAAKAAADAPPQIEVVTAHSPKKGKSLEGGGYLSVVTGTRFWAEHQLILDNILYATRLYEAEHGHYPKTQDEFMAKIIKPNEIDETARAAGRLGILLRSEGTARVEDEEHRHRAARGGGLTIRVMRRGVWGRIFGTSYTGRLTSSP